VGQILKRKNAQYVFYLHIFIYLIDREKETNFIQIMCEKRDRSTPEVSVFGSENSEHPW
jgi:hypothetical protein